MQHATVHDAVLIVPTRDGFRAAAGRRSRSCAAQAWRNVRDTAAAAGSRREQAALNRRVTTQHRFETRMRPLRAQLSLMSDEVRAINETVRPHLAEAQSPAAPRETAGRRLTAMRSRR